MAINPNTVLLMHMDDNVTDATGTHTPSAIGSPTYSTSQEGFNKAISLNGSSQYISIADSDDWTPTTNWTFECLVKWNNVSISGQQDYFFGQYDSGTDSFFNLIYRHNDDKLAFLCHSGSSFELFFTASFSPSVDTWYHIAFVKNGTTYYIFVDGVSQALNLESGSYSNSLTNVSSELYIGNQPVYQDYFNGYFDEIRIVQEAVWTSNFTPPERPYGLPLIVPTFPLPTIIGQNTIIPDNYTNTILPTNSVIPVTTDSVSWDLSSYVVAQYKMNDDAANTTVTNEQGTDGTLAGGDNTSVLSVTGKINDAFDFNGTDDYVNTNLSFESTFQNSFSIECWVKLDDGITGSTQYVLGSVVSDSLNRVYFDCGFDGKARFQYRSNSNIATAKTNTIVFPDGATGWIHYVGTADETNGIKLYINGSSQTLDPANDGDMSGVTMSAYSNTLNLFIGALNLNNVANNHLGGLLDNVRIFNKELSATEVGYLYNDGNGTENNSN